MILDLLLIILLLLPKFEFDTLDPVPRWSDLLLPSDDEEELLLMVTFNPPEEVFEPKLLDLSLLLEYEDGCCLFESEDEGWLVPGIEGIISIPPLDDDNCGDVEELLSFVIDREDDSFADFPP